MKSWILALLETDSILYLLISFLERSSQILDLNNIPKEIERIMQGIVILVVVVSYEVVRRYILTQEVKLASRMVDKDE